MFSESKVNQTKGRMGPHARDKNSGLNRWSNSTSSSRASTNTRREEGTRERLSGSISSQEDLGRVERPQEASSIAEGFKHQTRDSPQYLPWTPLRIQESLHSSGEPEPLKAQQSPMASISKPPTKSASMASNTHDLLGSSDSLRRGGELGNSWTNTDPSIQNPRGKGVAESAAPYQDQGSRALARVMSGPSSSKSNLNVPASQVNAKLGQETSSSTQRSSRHTRQPDRRETLDLSANGEEISSSKRRQNNVRKKHRAPSQKVMLSEALQKANYAVILDNAQDLIGAMEAYGEACDLLTRVMDRSTGEEEKRKLDTIRTTYRNRIVELRQNEIPTQTSHEKALPEVPKPSNQDTFDPALEIQVSGATHDAHMTRRHLTHHQWLPECSPTNETVQLVDDQEQPGSLPEEGLAPKTLPKETDIDCMSVEENGSRGTQNSADKLRVSLLNKADVPPPLSPRRPLSPEPKTRSPSQDHKSMASSTVSHNRQITAESTSWLDTIDESAGSSSPSVHSRSSSIGLRRKHIRTGSGATEAEFDAALDAAVEAAYDDGYEPASDVEAPIESTSGYLKAPSALEARENVDAAKLNFHKADSKAMFVALQMRATDSPYTRETNRLPAGADDIDYKEHEEKEEEEILEEMRKNNAPDENEHDPHSKGALPRQSDSSGLSGRTWGSSVASMSTSAGTPLSSVAETLALPHLPSQSHMKGPPLPPPTAALPPPPDPLTDSGDTSKKVVPTDLDKQPQYAMVTAGVRNRRLSGLQSKQLKIDTTARIAARHVASAAPRIPNPSLLDSSDLVENGPRSATVPEDIRSQYSNGTAKQERAGRDSATPETANSRHATSGNWLMSEKAKARKENAPRSPAPSSPARLIARAGSHGILKKNFSSSSLKSLRQQNGSPPMSEDSPSLIAHRTISALQQAQRDGQAFELPQLPSSAPRAAKPNLAPQGSSFLSRDLTTVSAAAHQSLSASQPPSLEACPESFLLRPFWLMRAIHQAIAHPRGGYVSTRLFMPRDAWRVENVKLKNVDEKVANCDLLTAALLNLSKVDTLDADAVLEEMQAFELLLDQVQGQLARKLGAEVGVNGSLSLFKSSSVLEENGPSQEVSIGKGVGIGSKSYLASWKKLRSKSSSASAVPSSSTSSGGREASRETSTTRPLRMTTSLDVRSIRREKHKIHGIGPHAHYMASLGRLCEAVQILDQIARQVEDPGLRLSSQTHVGLELCARHAAEFFAFFVKRVDLGMIVGFASSRGPLQSNAMVTVEEIQPLTILPSRPAPSPARAGDS